MPDVSKSLRFTTNWQSIEPAAFYDVYESVNFGLGSGLDFPSDYMKQIFCSGVFGFFVFHDDRLVGAARVFSDDIYCTWMAEICVRPEWQGKGVGKALIKMINSRFGHTALYGEAFKDQIEFFIKQGIKPKEKLVACSRAPLEKD